MFETTEYDLFLDAIAKKPDDWFPRLVFADWLIDLARVLRMSVLQVSVLIPLVTVSALNEPNSSLDESARHQTLSSEVLRGRIVQSVHFLR